MPTHEAMSQISRPFQIALVAVLLIAGVALFALHGRSTSTSSTTPASPTTSAPVASVAPKPVLTTHKAAAHHAGATHVYRGPVPGLEGLTRDVSRAHEAVAKVGESPRRAGTKAASHGSATTTPVKTAAPTTKAATRPAAKTPTVTKTTTKTTTGTKAAAKTPASPAHTHVSSSTAVTLSGQHAVEADLAKGDVVVLLFWNPKGTEDAEVHRAVQQVQSTARSQHSHVVVQEASAGQVASFGSVTRGVQVYATPTIFIIDKQGHAIVLTGVQDAFSIEQTIDEARSASPN
jgi:hypothetical protein